MSHWAAHLIGQPYSADRNCWAICREAFRLRWNIDLPEIAETRDNTYYIKRAADSGRIRPTSTGSKPHDGDLVIMRSAVKLHAGIVVVANHQTGVLHSTSETGVIWQKWAEAIDGMVADLWRIA